MADVANAVSLAEINTDLKWIKQKVEAIEEKQNDLDERIDKIEVGMGIISEEIKNSKEATKNAQESNYRKDRVLLALLAVAFTAINIGVAVLLRLR
ncbi:MAG: hypothetical protein QXP38_00675 [Nitrososphaerota archaeon]